MILTGTGYLGPVWDLKHFAEVLNVDYRKSITECNVGLYNDPLIP